MTAFSAFTPLKTSVIAALTAAFPALRSALLVLPLLLVTLACLPALTVLPFLPDGTRRATGIVRQLMCWTRVLTDVI